MSSLLIHQHQGAVVRTRVDPLKSMAFHRQAVLSLNPSLPSLPSTLLTFTEFKKAREKTAIKGTCWLFTTIPHPLDAFQLESRLEMCVVVCSLVLQVDCESVKSLVGIW